MERHLSLTSDGSHTLVIPELDEQYHSTHGAVQEAYHVFIDAALDHFLFKNTDQKSISILEIGFGTGLNAFITLLEAYKRSLKIDYTTLEAFPLEENEYLPLNYPYSVSGAAEFTEEFKYLHRCEWEKYVEIGSRFCLTKRLTKFEDFSALEQFDIVYFDAFSPRVQPELWSEAIFDSMFAALKTSGTLTTYCAKGSVRRAMLNAGFIVERLPGPAHKREMLRASKT